MKTSRCLSPAATLAAAFGCAAFLAAGTTRAFVVSEDTLNLLGQGQQSLVWAGTANLFQIADGATLTVTRFGQSPGDPGFATILPDASAKYEPLGATGRVIFENIQGVRFGGVFTMGANSSLDITNGIFRGNKSGSNTTDTAISSKNGDGVSGVIHAAQATAVVRLRDVVFENNGQFGNTGVMRISGTLVMDGGAAIGNWASGDHTGVFNMNGRPTLLISDALFDGNHARGYAGVISVGNGTIVFENTIFTNNWAGYQGGALRGGGDAASVFRFNLTASSGTSHYLYSGNWAGMQTADTLLMNDPQVLNNAPLFGPVAKAGGFLHGTASASTIEFAVAAGVDLTIGDPDETNKAYDSITTNGAAPKILKTGGGDLVLNADNSYWKGSSTVSAGRLLLGNDGALLGGTIVVTPGASFGGAGRVATMNYADDLPAAATVSIQSGGILQVGLETRQTGTLAITGALNLADATVNFVAFNGTHATQLAITSTTSGTTTITGALNPTGTNIINLSGFTQNGTYNLGDIYGALAANGDGTLLYAVNGLVSTPGGNGRQSAQRVITGDGSLQVQLSLDSARAMRWTGTDGAAPNLWGDAEENWAGLSAASADITRFAALDTVEFANITGTITLSGGAPVSNLAIAIGTGTLLFNGDGGITAAPWNSASAAEDSVRAAPGKLVKTGDGTLVFNNDGRNVFRGGVEIHGGAVEIQRGEQLQSTGGSLVFVNNATLRVANTGSTQLDNTIAIGEGKTATVEVVPSGTTSPVILSGNISGGKLVKSGAGVLRLSGSNSQEAVELQAGTLSLLHDAALGRGSLLVSGNNRSVTVAAGVTIANDIEFGSNNLVLYNVSTGTASTPQAAVVSGNMHGKSLAIRGETSGAGVRGPLMLAGNNMFETVTVGESAILVAASAGALGGAASVVNVTNGGELHLAATDVLARDVTVATGAVIGFDRPSRQMLTLSGTFTMESSSTVAILSRLTSGFTKLVHADGGIAYDSYGTTVVDLGENNNSSFIVYADDDNNLMLMNLNRAGNPGKDIAVSLDAMTASVSAIYHRMSESFILPLADYAPGASPEHGIWIKGIGSYADYDGGGSRLGFTDFTYGFAYGFDVVCADRYLLGFYGGYTDSTLKAGASAETNADMPHLGVYGAARFGKVYLAADLFGGAVKASTSRAEDDVTGRYKAAVYGASAETGLVFHTWDNGLFKPSAALHWMSFGYRDQAEKGWDAIFIDDFTADRLESVLGLQLTHSFLTAWEKPAMLTLNAGWRSALKNERTRLNVRFADMYVYDDNFAVYSDTYSRDRISLGVGLRANLTDTASLALDYECEAAKDHTRHSGNLALRWSW